MEDYKNKYIKYKKKYILQKKLSGGYITTDMAGKNYDNILSTYLTKDILFFDTRSIENKNVFDYLIKLQELDLDKEINENDIDPNKILGEEKFIGFKFKNVSKCIELVKNNKDRILNLVETTTKGLYYNNNTDALTRIFNEYFKSEFFHFTATQKEFDNYIKYYFPIVYSENYVTINIIDVIFKKLYTFITSGFITIELFIDEDAYKYYMSLIERIHEKEIKEAIVKRINSLICKYNDIDYVNGLINKKTLFNFFFPNSEKENIYMAKNNCMITQTFLKDLISLEKIDNEKYKLLPMKFKDLYYSCMTNSIKFRTLKNYYWCYKKKSGSK